MDQKESKIAGTSVEAREADQRSTARASIYLPAALYCDGSSSPVRIRNISATGALVEGSEVPSAGALVQLVRGGLIVHALVAWCGQGRCGLKFSGSVDADEWLGVPINSEQQRVDEVVRLVKAGAVPLPVPPLAYLSESVGMCDPAQHLSEDLRSASELLDKLSEVLASDLDVVARHGPALQNLDIAMQVIAAVAAIVDGQGEAGVDAMKLAALRRSAEQALQNRV